MIRCNIYGRQHVFKNAIGLSILLIILFSGSALGDTNITQCGEINSPGGYVLTQNIWNAGNSAVLSCINITASNVIFEGNSHFVVGNTAAVGTIGVYVNNPATITNVTVKNLTLKNFSTGIYAIYSINNNFTGNNLSNNSKGINLSNSFNNNIYNNYFNNTLNAVSDSTPNSWNTTKQPGINIINGSYLGGNFWANSSGNGFSQTCAVSNNDGICNSAYNIDTNNVDQLPLTKNTTLPAIRYINGTVLDSVSRTGIAGVNVSLNTSNSTVTNATGFYSFVVAAGTFNLTATFDFRYYTNNSVMVSTESSPVVIQDIVLIKKPTGTITGKVVRYSMIRIDSPQDIIYHITEIPLNVSADKSISIWNYSLNGEANVTFTSGINITAIQGQNNLTVYAMDLAGNWDSNSVSFFVDSIPPASVTNLQNVSYALNYINWTWADPQDADFAKVMIYLDGTYKEDVSRGVQYYNATGLSPARYTIGVRTVDASGNMNATIINNTSITILPLERYINGTVLDSVNKTGISGVIVSTNTTVSTMTNETGFYSLPVTGGIFSLTASLDPAYYTNSSITVSTEFRAVAIQDIELMKKPTGNITGNVTTNG